MTNYQDDIAAAQLKRLAPRLKEVGLVASTPENILKMGITRRARLYRGLLRDAQENGFDTVAEYAEAVGKPKRQGFLRSLLSKFA